VLLQLDKAETKVERLQQRLADEVRQAAQQHTQQV
jgi:hypothetical protein